MAAEVEEMRAELVAAVPPSVAASPIGTPPPLPPEVQAVLEDPSQDVREWAAYDTETYRFFPGRMAPKIVCASVAGFYEGQIRGALLVGETEALRVASDLLEVACTCPPALDMAGRAVVHHVATCARRRRKVVLANAAYDLAVLIEARPELRWAIFQALREGRIYDVLIAEALNAIYGGHLGKSPSGAPMYNAATGRVVDKYSLATVVQTNLGRVDSKDNDDWRMSYALLDGVPEALWPKTAVSYPVDDARNTLEVAIAQVLGPPGLHRWKHGVCQLCAAVSGSQVSPACPAAPRSRPHQNLENLPAQVEADFAATLGSYHSFRTDPERVEALIAEAEELHVKAVAKFQKKGWIRDDGSEDQCAVKRAVAIAYGAKAPCARCGGKGRIARTKREGCRGVKVKNRYQGCGGPTCIVCRGAGEVEIAAGEVTCKNEWDDAGTKVLVKGCDGTGFDLDSVRVLPRTDKLGVRTDRDAKSESGDEDLADYGNDQFEKTRTTFGPYLRKGYDRPLPFNIDILKATGRMAVGGSPLHQFPRAGKERRCIRARGPWCGYPHLMWLGSTDYAAGELCTLAEATYALFGYSKMRDTINRYGDPGVLHSETAAEVMGISLEEFLKRLHAKDVQAKYFRQASKPDSFGKPALMGAPKIVWTNRKESAGFTPCEGGPARNDKGEEGYHGIRFCVLVGGAKRCGETMITSWGKRGYPCVPVCKRCVEIEAFVITPAYFRRFPEIKDYHRWVIAKTDRREPAPSIVWDAEAQAHRIIRLRGGCDVSTFANNIFQSMLADITKAAYVRVTRECYLGVKDDGSPSPLAGCYAPLMAHDEIISELIAETAHLSGPRISEIMLEEGYRVAPHVTWKADTALMDYWYKQAEPVVKDGRLMLWQPKALAA